MTSLEDIQNELNKIKERNKKVEQDKAWEMSLTRKFLLAIFTYSAITFYMYAMKLPNPLFNAIIPTAGFLLSTLTLPYFKSWWLKSKNSD